MTKVRSALKTKGLHTHRFKENPDEKKFAQAWAEQNMGSSGTLAYLLADTRGQSQGIRPLNPSERDQVVAATVIQWLGSPVGIAVRMINEFEKIVQDAYPPPNKINVRYLHKQDGDSS